MLRWGDGGRHNYTLPVAYTRHDEILLIGTPFAWGRNVHTGEPLDIRLMGKRVAADVQVVSDEAGVVEHCGLMARDDPDFEASDFSVLLELVAVGAGVALIPQLTVASIPEGVRLHPLRSPIWRHDFVSRA